MRERNIELKVGILVVVALALFAGFVFVLGEFRTGDRRVIEIDFETSADLQIGAPVKIAGITVGKVSGVSFWGGKTDEATTRPVQVRVALQVDSTMADAVREDARAYISTLGILGEKYVEIEPGSFDSPALPEGGILIGEPPLRLELVARDLSGALNQLALILEENRGTIGDTLKNLNKLIVDADQLILDNREAVSQLLAQLNESAERLDTLLVSGQTALGDGTEIRQALSNVQSATARVDRSIGPIVQKLDSALVSAEGAAKAFQAVGEDSRTRVIRILDEGGEVLEDVAFVANAIRQGRGSIGALLADQDLYNSVKEMIADLQRHPWKFIWKE